MNILLEKRLHDLSSTVINHASIKSLLKGCDYKRCNDKINYMKKQKVLKYLKRGMYIYDSPYFKNIISKEIIANNLLGPSYISYDYALSYYNLIPERVYEITSATTKRAKSFKTDFGIFNYKQISNKLYPVGINILSTAKGHFMIASKEKALCDKICSVKGLQIRSKKNMIEFLEEDLRIDLEELSNLDFSVIKKCYDCSKSVKLKFLAKVIMEIQA